VITPHVTDHDVPVFGPCPDLIRFILLYRSPAHAWYVDMAGGRMFYGGKDQSFMVWPVRGPLVHRLPVSGQRTCHDTLGARIDCIGS